MLNPNLPRPVSSHYAYMNSLKAEDTTGNSTLNICSMSSESRITMPYTPVAVPNALPAWPIRLGTLPPHSSCSCCQIFRPILQLVINTLLGGLARRIRAGVRR